MGKIIQMVFTGIAAFVNPNEKPAEKAEEKLAPPIGLDMETRADDVDELEIDHSSDEDVLEENDHLLPTAVESLEKAVRQSPDGELEVASKLNRVQKALSECEDIQTANAVKGRVNTMVAKELNEMDGFDR